MEAEHRTDRLRWRRRASHRTSQAKGIHLISVFITSSSIYALPGFWL